MVRVPAWRLAARQAMLSPLEARNHRMPIAFQVRLRHDSTHRICTCGQLSLTTVPPRTPSACQVCHVPGLPRRTGSGWRPGALSARGRLPSRDSDSVVRIGDEESRITTPSVRPVGSTVPYGNATTRTRSPSPVRGLSDPGFRPPRASDKRGCTLGPSAAIVEHLDYGRPRLIAHCDIDIRTTR